MGDMVPCRGGLFLRHSAPPLFPRQELELCLVAEMREHRLRVLAQSQWSWRDDMKTLADGIVGVSQRELECLRDIIGVYMVHRLHSFVRELQQLAASDAREHVGIEMP